MTRGPDRLGGNFLEKVKSLVCFQASSSFRSDAGVSIASQILTKRI